MARSVTTGIVFIIAALWTFWTLLVFGCALFYQFVGLESGPDPDSAGTLYVCSVVNFTVMILLIAAWHAKKKKEDMADELASYLKMYRRTPLAKIASRMNIDQNTAEQLLLQCISKGQINGYLDRNTDEFILKDSISEMKAGRKCPTCGGYSTAVSLSGEVVRCQFCAAVIPDGTPAVPKQTPAPNPSKGTKIMLCSNCRKEIPLDSNLCPYCGQHF